MKTYQECFEFFNAANQWMIKNPDESKLKYALGRVTKRISKLQEQFREKVEEINIENCAVDDKGIILRDDKNNFQFNKEGLLKRNREVSELHKTKVELEPYFATEVTEKLTPVEEEIFTGFVLKGVDAGGLL